MHVPMPDLLIFLTIALFFFAARPGQPNRMAWLLRLTALLLLTPLLRYVGAVFGFAARLKLSAWAGMLMQHAGVAVRTEGNVLILNGQEMAVDPACLGLHMTGMTLLLAVFWLLAYERQTGRRLPLGWVLGYGGVALGLTLLANLLRIIMLVLFGLGSDQPMHEGVGLVCVVIYAWLPLWIMARWLVGRFGRPWQVEPPDNQLMSKSLWKTVPLILVVAVVCFAFVRPIGKPYSITPPTDYTRKPTQFGFLQFSRPGELIYVKPLPDWFSAEHNPAICWQGQGYTLRRVRELPMAGHMVYVGELKKGHQTLQTAWWFTNGQHQSIGQIDVRTRMLRGEPGFVLINVTASDAQALPALVREWK